MRRTRGFTLIELLVGSIVFSVVIAASFQMVVAWGKAAARGSQISDSLNKGRTAIQQISDDVRHAYYIYHYANITLGDDLKARDTQVNQCLGAGKMISIPLVTDGSAPRFNIPGYTWVPVAAQSSLCLLKGAVSTPTYVLYTHVPGPATPDKPTVTELKYKPLWYHLVKVTMDCAFEPSTAQGGWLRMDAHYDQFAAEPASRSVLSFKATQQNFAGGACSAAKTTDLGTMANDDMFNLVTDHPYAVEGPVSPYYVEIALDAGDPTNLLTVTGGDKANSGSVVGNRIFQVVRFRSEAYAQNVTMPGAR